jgi:pyridoxal phosphate enzyme (YggS family)
MIEGPPHPQNGAIASALAAVRDRIASAAERAGRSLEEIRLVVVTKDVSSDRARAAVAAGASELGENRAKELLSKMTDLAGLTPEPRWHFIGTLQRNKVRPIAGRVSLIHSVNSITLGRVIAARAAGSNVTQDVLLEVNVAGEPSKQGLTPEATPETLEVLSSEAALNIRGLMTIAPAGSKAVARAAFADLRDLRDRLRDTLPGATLEELSMGMTSDFEEAIEEGATIVRIGTAIFGERKR